MSQGSRHHLLYARQNWRDTRIVLVLVSLAYAGFGMYTIYARHRVAEGRVFVTSALFPLLLIPLIYAYSRMTYIDVLEDHLLLHFAFRRVRVPYTEIERTRIDGMERLFAAPEYKRQRSGIVRRLYRERAVCLRVREEYADANRRALGPRNLLDREIVLPLQNPEVASESIRLRLVARRRAMASASVAAASAAPGRRGRRRRRGRR